MNRRTFVLLSGAASGGLLDPNRWLRVPTRDDPPAVGGLRFTCDERQRWTLSYHGDGVPVPVVTDAELGIRLADRLVTLQMLEGVTVRRQFGPERRVLVVSGTTAGIAVEASFLDAVAGDCAAITVTVSPDRVQAVVRGVQYFTLPAENVLPGPGTLQALINGYHSWSESQVMAIGETEGERVSHAALGLSRHGRGLALAFDPGEPGEAAVYLARGILDTRSDWLPARPLQPDGDTATLRLAFDPSGDEFTALTQAFAPAPVDRDRFAAGAPSGWCSWYQLSDRVTEDDIIANLDACATHFDPRFLRYIRIDDGYQRSAGDWEANEKFPHGHRWLTDQIHARGLNAGLWIAPFGVTERSGIPAAHPGWLVRRNGIPVSFGTNAGWGGAVYALDPAHPEVRDWLRDLARRVVQEWGYDHLKIDFLHYATAGDAHAGGATHAEAYRAGLAAIRQGLGTDAFLLASGAPLQHAVGTVNGMRIGGDVAASWDGIQAPARAAALRGFFHRGVWFNDPDCLVVRPPLSLDEARVWTAIVALSGGMTLLADDLSRLPADRLALLQRALPVAPTATRAGAADRLRPDTAPVIHGVGVPVPLRGPWQFHSGDAASGTLPAPDWWITESMPGWWTIALVNWRDDPGTVAVPTSRIGITAPRCAVYDVWEDTPRPDVTDMIRAQLAPHTSLVLALRRAVRRPQIVGSTRHVVQGAIDIARETWDRTTRTLRATSTQLDARAYAVTIAVPPGLAPVECSADIPCVLTRLPSGHAVIEWTDGTQGKDVDWRLTFKQTLRR